MKKMMMIATIALLAIGAQAATATWTVSALKAPLAGGAFSGTALNGGIAYLFVGASTAGVADAIQAATFTGAGSLWSQASTASGVISKAGLGSYSGQSVSMYMVVFDGASIATSSYFMVSAVNTQTFTTVNKTYTFTTANTMLPTSWTQITVVPEPTSMALLAIGGAIFGLRRKFRK